MTACDVCTPNHYRTGVIDDQTKHANCTQACDPGLMVCSASEGEVLESLRLRPGHYRESNSTDVPYIKKCPHEPACLGGNKTGNASCAEGHTGPVCAVCMPDYHLNQVTGACEKCSDRTTQALTAAVLLAVAVGCAYGVRRQHKRMFDGRLGRAGGRITAERMAAQDDEWLREELRACRPKLFTADRTRPWPRQRLLDELRAAAGPVDRRVRTAVQFQLRSAFVPKLKILIPFVQVIRRQIPWYP